MKRSTLALIGVIALAIVVGFLFMPDLKPQPGEPDPNGQSSSAASSMMTTSSAVSRGRELSCTDAVDNDGDRLADCDDPDCASMAGCRCQAYSCGDPSIRGSTHTCVPEEGCICDAVNACVPCRGDGQVCGTDADCCQGTGLHCQEFLVSGNERQKRCAPVERRVCEIECQGEPGSAQQGRWGRPESCGTGVPPPDAKDCTLLTGVCDLSRTAERNTVKCWQS